MDLFVLDTITMSSLTEVMPSPGGRWQEDSHWFRVS